MQKLPSQYRIVNRSTVTYFANSYLQCRCQIRRDHCCHYLLFKEELESIKASQVCKFLLHLSCFLLTESGKLSQYSGLHLCMLHNRQENVGVKWCTVTTLLGLVSLYVYSLVVGFNFSYSIFSLISHRLAYSLWSTDALKFTWLQLALQRPYFSLLHSMSYTNCFQGQYDLWLSFHMQTAIILAGRFQSPPTLE